MLPDLTPISDFNGWWAKREDLAGYSGPEFPSGSKVRQYLAMAKTQPGAPMLVGCSANSAMQIYVAAAAYQTGAAAIIYTAQRQELTAATAYAKRLGAEINGVKPGYLSLCRKRAKERSIALGVVVRWNVMAALEDAALQCANLPEAARIVVSTGSGLTCAGVLAGLARAGRQTPVLALAVSPLATAEGIVALAKKLTDKPLPSLALQRTPGEYDEWKAARLPDGTPLDPFYAAKALSFVQPGDCLWVPGVRPVSSMPVDCQRAYA